MRARKKQKNKNPSFKLWSEIVRVIVNRDEKDPIRLKFDSSKILPPPRRRRPPPKKIPFYFLK